MPKWCLDIQVAGAAAPGAKYVVYFAPNDASSKGFIDALTKAIHDTQNNPSVVSISWGGPESVPNTSYQKQFDQVLQAAAMLGVTVLVAAGDSGAADVGPKEWDGKAHVDFPSSSPYALSCGGTRLITNGTHNCGGVGLESEPGGCPAGFIRFGRGWRERGFPVAGLSELLQGSEGA